MTTSAVTIHTIGHSNHSIDHFIALLKGAGITALADVRSKPFSRYCPHFNRKALAAAMAQANIGYVFLGEALGGKPQSSDLFSDGKPDYGKITASPLFQHGIGQLVAVATDAPTAIMCAERDPLQCHRTHLVTPALLAHGLSVCHILADGSLQSHADLPKPAQGDLFLSE